MATRTAATITAITTSPCSSESRSKAAWWAASRRPAATTAPSRSTRAAARESRAEAATSPSPRRSPRWARRSAWPAASTRASSIRASSGARSCRARSPRRVDGRRDAQDAGPACAPPLRDGRFVCAGAGAAGRLRPAHRRADCHRGGRAGEQPGHRAGAARARAAAAGRGDPPPSRCHRLGWAAALHPGGQHELAGPARLERLVSARRLRGRLGGRRRRGGLPLPPLALLGRRRGHAPARAAGPGQLLGQAQPGRQHADRRSERQRGRVPRGAERQGDLHNRAASGAGPARRQRHRARAGRSLSLARLARHRLADAGVRRALPAPRLRRPRGDQPDHLPLPRLALPARRQREAGAGDAPAHRAACDLRRHHRRGDGRMIALLCALAAAPPLVEVSLAPVRLGLAVYPAGASRLPLISDVSFYGSYARSLKSRTLTSDQALALDSQIIAWEAGARFRGMVGGDERYAISIGYGSLRNDFSGAQLPGVLLPAGTLQYWRPGAELRFPFGAFAVALGAGYLAPVRQDAVGAAFPRASSGGVDGTLRASIALGAFELTLSGRYTRFFYSLHPMPFDPYVA